MYMRVCTIMCVCMYLCNHVYVPACLSVCLCVCVCLRVCVYQIRRLDREEAESAMDYSSVDMIYDPQTFAEKLFRKLRGTTQVHADKHNLG